MDVNIPIEVGTETNHQLHNVIQAAHIPLSPAISCWGIMTNLHILYTFVFSLQEWNQRKCFIRPHNVQK